MAREKDKKMNAVEYDKAALLNFRPSYIDEVNCGRCEHFDTKDREAKQALRRHLCKVIGENVYDKCVCKAFNDCNIENTWHLFALARMDRLYVVVKEVKGERERSLLNETVTLPVKSVDLLMVGYFEDLFKRFHCPDMVVNLSPEKFNGEALRMTLEHFHVKYNWLREDTDGLHGDFDNPLDAFAAAFDAHYAG